ncbi:MAG: TraR/DksA C4-type zinc finger protein [Sedimentisphaerales bacterium]|nr:TraR/DksA C4-type zinc finger protein [Sedimentisphaerales bacterium]
MTQRNIRNLNHFKTILLSKRNEVLKNFSELEYEFQQPKIDKGPLLPSHPAEAGTDNFDLENTAELLENERNILNDIDRALECMEQGMYGLCESCQKPISLKRLQAIPCVRLCVNCADKEEKIRSNARRPFFRMRPFPYWQ